MAESTTIKVLSVVLCVLIGIALNFTSVNSYLLFPNLAELFAITVAFSVFIVGWHSREYTGKPGAGNSVYWR